MSYKTFTKPFKVMISYREEERLREELDPAGGGGDPVGGAVVQQEGVGREVPGVAEGTIAIKAFIHACAFTITDF